MFACYCEAFFLNLMAPIYLSFGPGDNKVAGTGSEGNSKTTNSIINHTNILTFPHSAQNLSYTLRFSAYLINKAQRKMIIYDWLIWVSCKLFIAFWMGFMLNIYVLYMLHNKALANYELEAEACQVPHCAVRWKWKNNIVIPVHFAIPLTVHLHCIKILNKNPTWACCAV